MEISVHIPAVWEIISLIIKDFFWNPGETHLCSLYEPWLTSHSPLKSGPENIMLYKRFLIPSLEGCRGGLFFLYHLSLVWIWKRNDASFQGYPVRRTKIFSRVLLQHAVCDLNQVEGGWLHLYGHTVHSLIPWYPAARNIVFAFSDFKNSSSSL